MALEDYLRRTKCIDEFLNFFSPAEFDKIVKYLVVIAIDSLNLELISNWEAGALKEFLKNKAKRIGHLETCELRKIREDMDGIKEKMTQLCDEIANQKEGEAGIDGEYPEENKSNAHNNKINNAQGKNYLLQENPKENPQGYYSSPVDYLHRARALSRNKQSVTPKVTELVPPREAVPKGAVTAKRRHPHLDDKQIKSCLLGERSDEGKNKAIKASQSLAQGKAQTALIGASKPNKFKLLALREKAKGKRGNSLNRTPEKGYKVAESKIKDLLTDGRINSSTGFGGNRFSFEPVFVLKNDKISGVCELKESKQDALPRETAGKTNAISFHKASEFGELAIRASIPSLECDESMNARRSLDKPKSFISNNENPMSSPSQRVVDGTNQKKKQISSGSSSNQMHFNETSTYSYKDLAKTENDTILEIANRFLASPLVKNLGESFGTARSGLNTGNRGQSDVKTDEFMLFNKQLEEIKEEDMRNPGLGGQLAEAKGKEVKEEGSFPSVPGLQSKTIQKDKETSNLKDNYKKLKKKYAQLLQEHSKIVTDYERCLEEVSSLNKEKKYLRKRVAEILEAQGFTMSSEDVKNEATHQI